MKFNTNKVIGVLEALEVSTFITFITFTNFYNKKFVFKWKFNIKETYDLS